MTIDDFKIDLEKLVREARQAGVKPSDLMFVMEAAAARVSMPLPPTADPSTAAPVSPESA